MERPDFFELKNGSRAKLPFTDQEYKNRLNKIRKTMSKKKIDMISRYFFKVSRHLKLINNPTYQPRNLVSVFLFSLTQVKFLNDAGSLSHHLSF